MSKADKKSEGGTGHVVKADVRHKYEVKEFADFTRREKKSDGSEKLMPRLAVLAPLDGGKQVRAYVPGNLEEPLELGYIVMVRPHEQKGKNDGPPVKFRITNVLEARRGGGGPQITAGEIISAKQNAQLGTGANAGAAATSDERAAAVR